MARSMASWRRAPAAAALSSCGTATSARRSVTSGAARSPTPPRSFSAKASRRLSLPPDEREDLAGGPWDVGAWTVDRADARRAQELVILRRHHAAADDEDVVGSLAAQSLDQCRHQRLVAGGLAGDADHMHVVLDRLPRRLLGRLEERPDIHVEAEIGEGRRDHLGAAVMAVLAELDDEEPRPPPLLLGEGLDLLAHPAEALVALIGRAVDAGDAANGGAVAGEDALERLRDLAHRGARPRRLDGELEEIARLAGGRGGEGLEGRAAARLVAARAHLAQAMDLRLAHLGVVDGEHIDLRLLLGAVFVDANDDLLAAVDARLAPRRRLLDAELGHARLDVLGHAAQGLDLLGDAGLVAEDELGVARDPRRERGRQRQRLVEGVGVEGLRAAEHGGQRLD